MGGIIDNLTNAINTWNEKMAEIWLLLTQTPQNFKGGHIWEVIVKIHGGLTAIGLALLVLFFVIGMVKTCTNLTEIKRPEHALRLFFGHQLHLFRGGKNRRRGKFPHILADYSSAGEARSRISHDPRVYRQLERLYDAVFVHGAVSYRFARVVRTAAATGVRFGYAHSVCRHHHVDAAHSYPVQRVPKIHYGKHVCGRHQGLICKNQQRRRMIADASVLQLEIKFRRLCLRNDFSGDNFFDGIADYQSGGYIRLFDDGHISLDALYQDLRGDLSQISLRYGDRRERGSQIPAFRNVAYADHGYVVGDLQPRLRYGAHASHGHIVARDEDRGRAVGRRNEFLCFRKATLPVPAAVDDPIWFDGVIVHAHRDPIGVVAFHVVGIPLGQIAADKGNFFMPHVGQITHRARARFEGVVAHVVYVIKFRVYADQMGDVFFERLDDVGGERSQQDQPLDLIF